MKWYDNLLVRKATDYGRAHVDLVVRIKNAPSFETLESLACIDQVISFHLPSKEKDPDLRTLAKRDQITITILYMLQEEFWGLLICFFSPVMPANFYCATEFTWVHWKWRMILQFKKKTNEKFVNYHHILLWNANMNVQPCGSNEPISHYVALYIFCIDFGRDGTLLIKVKSVQFLALRNYGTNRTVLVLNF